MSKNRNCKNCGAPIDIKSNKCPFCGTSYFDLSDIEIDKPVFLKIKFNNQLLITKACCTSCDINFGCCDECPTINLEFIGLGGVKESDLVEV